MLTALDAQYRPGVAGVCGRGAQWAQRCPHLIPRITRSAALRICTTTGRLLHVVAYKTLNRIQMGGFGCGLPRDRRVTADLFFLDSIGELGVLSASFSRASRRLDNFGKCLLGSWVAFRQAGQAKSLRRPDVA